MFDYVELGKKYNAKQLEKLRNHTPNIIKCVSCSNTFDSLSYHFRPTAIYPYIKKTCCRQCTNTHISNTKRIFVANNVCNHCGGEFIPNPKKPHKKYCNHKCYSNSRKNIPNPHVRAYNLKHKKCPPHGSISRWETKWLNQYELTHTQYQIIIDGCSLIVDGFNENTNTVYEYFGSFWHGNPDIYNPNDVNIRTKTTFGHLYAQTISRIERIRSAGYNLIYEWSPR